jgi:hypothetical protein
VSGKVGVELGPWRPIDIRGVLGVVSSPKAYKTALIAVLPLVIGDAAASYGRGREAARIAAEAAREHPTRFARCAHTPAVRAVLDTPADRGAVPVFQTPAPPPGQRTADAGG